MCEIGMVIGCECIC